MRPRAIDSAESSLEVEQSAVNRSVGGSIPPSRAILPVVKVTLVSDLKKKKLHLATAGETEHYGGRK